MVFELECYNNNNKCKKQCKIVVSLLLIFINLKGNHLKQLSLVKYHFAIQQMFFLVICMCNNSLMAPSELVAQAHLGPQNLGNKLARSQKCPNPP